MHGIFLFRFRLLTFFLLGASEVSRTQWIHVGLDSTSPGNVIPLGSNLFVGTNGDGVFRSTDNGATWGPVNNGLTSLNTLHLAATDANLVAGAQSVSNGNGVFRSTNNGEIWTPANTGLTDSFITALAVGPNPSGGTLLYAGTFSSQIFLSSDEGGNWSLLGSNIGGGSTLEIIGSYIFTSNPEYDLSIVSSNYGASWSVGPPHGALDWAYTLNQGAGFNVFACASTGIYTGGGLLRSTDSTKTWHRPNLQSRNVVNLAASGTSLFAQYEAGWGDTVVGVFLSTNNGTSWTNVSAGQPDSGKFSHLSIANGFLFRSVSGGGLWRRPLADMITYVTEASSTQPERYQLSQNYPNPFNSTTTIEFQIPNSNYATLKVYDPLGREVSTLVSEVLPAGTHSRQWDAERMASGVYFYRLNSGSFFQTRKLVLMR